MSLINTGAERYILACCIQDEDCIVECEALGLHQKHFGLKINGVLFNAMLHLLQLGQKVDPISISNTIKDNNAISDLEQLGGEDYLLLLQQQKVRKNIKYFVTEIVDMYNKKKLKEYCEYAIENLHKENLETSMHVLSNNINSITNDSLKNMEAYKMGNLLDIRLEKYKNAEEGIHGIKVGWDKFDEVTAGAIGGDLIIVCAEAKTGKSVTLLNWAENICIKQRKPILFIDTEQSNEEQELRLLSIITKIPEIEIKTGLYVVDTDYGKAEDKIERINKAKAILAESLFFHVNMPDFTLDKVEALAKKYKLKYDIEAIFFDYIKFNPALMKQSKGLRDDLILEVFTSGLKGIADTLDIPIFTAAQENRMGYGSTQKDAKNIGGSLGILKLATKLLFLRNQTQEEMVMNKRPGNQVLIIKYQRHGSCDIEINIQYLGHILTQYEAR